jgi:hypothetical protein
MSIKTNKLLLAVMILALVITPLRGAWAFATPASTDDMSHCDQMDMSSTAMQADVHHPDTTPETGHQCETGCNGDCCDGSCNACAHIVISLSNTIVVSQNLHNTPLSVTFPVSFPHRTIIPPLRPPASL